VFQTEAPAANERTLYLIDELDIDFCKVSMVETKKDPEQ
jgi:hypothetical protein